MLRINGSLGKVLRVPEGNILYKSPRDSKFMKNKLDSKFRYIKVKISGKSW